MLKKAYHDSCIYLPKQDNLQHNVQNLIESYGCIYLPKQDNLQPMPGN